MTPERTRAIASVDDLCQMTGEPDSARALLGHLVRSRLLVANSSCTRLIRVASMSFRF